MSAEPDHPKPAPAAPADLASRTAAWAGILQSGVQAQRLVPGAVCVGGTAAALYAGHRVSLDTDHLLPALRDSFGAVRARLEAQPDWKTARVTPPVLILGSIGGVAVGFRQLRRSLPLETQTVPTAAGPLVIPTLDEMLGMKAFLAYDRNATRDYLDFAALSECAPPAAVLAALLKLDARYGSLQTASVGLEVAKALCAAAPFDLDETELPHYKGLLEKWHRWETTRALCHRYGVRLGEALIQGGA